MKSAAHAGRRLLLSKPHRYQARRKIPEIFFSSLQHKNRAENENSFMLTSQLFLHQGGQRRVFSASSSKPQISKVLIANRGEIAVRIIRTCQRLGIKTVAVYSSIDSQAMHVKLADESVCIGPAPSLSSYLCKDSIINAAKETGADAIHPGYGFLSENASFATQVFEEGLVFVGPPAHAIEKMGDKISSKEIAKKAGVNTIPGFEGVIKNEDEAVTIANQIGYPVMIKATAGGGGKGMRIAWSDDDAREGYQLSSVEALKFFDDERVFIEKYIENPHHIEIQVLSGRVPSIGKGEEKREIKTICFPERECSIQRRNQKILEESPCVWLLPETRNKMVRQCKALVQTVSYWSAGTVEFLVDENQNFYFLEMNTRLQVEHPVTEMVTGVDLVELMLRVANEEGVDEELIKRAEDNALDNCIITSEETRQEWKEGGVVPYKGHAIEARIYAEDPLRNFLPSTGPLLRYVEPNLPNIRIDSGVSEGNIISTHYDPMISKLISYSNSRNEAINNLSDALDRYVIMGVRHNIPFASSLCRHQQFREARTPTSFIDTHYPDGFSGVELTLKEKQRLAAISVCIARCRDKLLHSPPLPLHHSNKRIVVLGGMFGEPVEVTLQDDADEILVNMLRDEQQTSVHVEGLSYFLDSPIAEVTVDGELIAVQVLNQSVDDVLSVKMHGASLDILIMSPEEFLLSNHMKAPSEVDTTDLLMSPMPGTLISYAVEDGDEVVAGQELCIVEAMKMQNMLRSSRAGVISKLVADLGSSLRADQVILEFQKEC